MRVFILEDDRGREELIREALRKRFGDGIGIVSAASAITAGVVLKGSRSWDFVFLDHDLTEGNGQDVAHLMVELKVSTREVVIQSVNDDGARKMKGILEVAGYTVTLASFNSLVDGKLAILKRIEELVP